MVIDESIIGGNLESKKFNTNVSTFRVKNSSKINSNALLMDKSSSMVGDKSSGNLFNTYDDMGFAKLRTSKQDM
jgi:hypothetical protein